ncbi:MAG TPA: glycosyl hydrolase family 3 [Cyanobacteria bacterium UBA8803]|nr:glycosyl hydrolase family 3 [Cyanobacteria bacterium UBA9273]HBL60358.1 glycosyl hydrolase family 3 [Cyanobacteria bacterium UBA8803]
MTSIILFVKLCLAILIVWVACYFRTPLLASVRLWAFWGLVLLSVGLLLTEIPKLKIGTRASEKGKNGQIIISWAIATLTAFGLASAATSEVKFNLTKQTVLNQDHSQLGNLGQHFIIGYRNFDEIKQLVEKRAIGGVFITARNIKNKTKAEIQQEIQTLQAIRTSQKLSPLWIATDQEGGIVSRLSPPLTKLPQLSAIIEQQKTLAQKKAQVMRYASIHGQELSELGVNLNFAPVVDLNKGIINPKDKFSQIYRRAISADKDIVAQVALWYCQTLETYQVKCTLKHFPGLGRVNADTHLEHAELKNSVQELSQDDWVPFREVMSKSGAFTMLGHAKLTAIDAHTPVSFSQPVITGIIRQQWQHNGILITDDFSMEAVHGSPDRIEKATVKALNAGVDLILISYDKDLYYPAIAALLKAKAAGHLVSATLVNSSQRLEQAKLKMEN